MNAVPPTGNQAVCVLAMTLPNQDLAVTALNYGRSPNTVQVDLTQIPPGIPASQVAGQSALDVLTDQNVETVSNAGMLTINLNELSGQTLVIHRQGVSGGSPSPTPNPPTPPVTGSVSPLK
jgi:hypothetical protein